MCWAAVKMTNRPVSPSRRRARELEREARDMGSRKRREFVILLLGYGREGRDIAHLYDYFMVRPVTHTHTRAGRQWLEALHHARSRRFPVYNPAGLCVCVYVRAFPCGKHSGPRTCWTCPRMYRGLGWTWRRAYFTHTDRTGAQLRAVTRQKVIHVKQKAEHGTGLEHVYGNFR